MRYSPHAFPRFSWHWSGIPPSWQLGDCFGNQPPSNIDIMSAGLPLAAIQAPSPLAGGSSPGLQGEKRPSAPSLSLSLSICQA